MADSLACTQTDLSALDLFFRTIKTSDGDDLSCTEKELTPLDIWKRCIKYDSATDQYFINIDFSGSYSIVIGGGRWRLFVDAADGYDLKTQKSTDGGTTWTTVDSNNF